MQRPGSLYFPITYFPFKKVPSVFSLRQTRQPVFVQLLQGVFRVYHCNWLTPTQKASVESCIKVLSDVGKSGSLGLRTVRAAGTVHKIHWLYVLYVLTTCSQTLCIMCSQKSGDRHSSWPGQPGEQPICKIKQRCTEDHPELEDVRSKRLPTRLHSQCVQRLQEHHREASGEHQHSNGTHNRETCLIPIWLNHQGTQILDHFLIRINICPLWTLCSTKINVWSISNVAIHTIHVWHNHTHKDTGCTHLNS